MTDLGTSVQSPVSIRRLSVGVISYLLLVLVAWVAMRGSSVGVALGSIFGPAFLSFALLLAPLWLFGFGAGGWLRERVRSAWLRIGLSALLGVPSLLFFVTTSQSRTGDVIAMFLLPVGIAFLLDTAASSAVTWQDGVVLAVVAAIAMAKLLAPAWPYPGLPSLPKLFLLDAVLYAYIVVRNLPGIGYSLLPTARTFLTGLREWAFFLPFGIGLGFGLRFIHFHAVIPGFGNFAGRVAVTFLLVAIPEEIFFRGVLQNLLESRFGRGRALALASVLFGLGHFNKGATFNWRYVILATIAGVFYGRAWREQRQILASVITHTAVDVVWSVWFR